MSPTVADDDGFDLPGMELPKLGPPIGPLRRIERPSAESVRPDAGDWDRFTAIWRYCMIDHEVGTLPSGPCYACVKAYAKSGPPDGRWNGAIPDVNVLIDGGACG